MEKQLEEKRLSEAGLKGVVLEYVLLHIFKRDATSRNAGVLVCWCIQHSHLKSLHEIWIPERPEESSVYDPVRGKVSTLRKHNRLEKRRNTGAECFYQTEKGRERFNYIKQGIEANVRKHYKRTLNDIILSRRKPPPTSETRTSEEIRLDKKLATLSFDATPSNLQPLREKYIPLGQLRDDLVQIMSGCTKCLYHPEQVDGKAVLSVGIMPEERACLVLQKLAKIHDYEDDIRVFALQAEKSTLGFGAPVATHSAALYGLARWASQPKPVR